MSTHVSSQDTDQAPPAGVRVLLTRQPAPKVPPGMFASWSEVESVVIVEGRSWQRQLDGSLCVFGEVQGHVVAEFPEGQWRGVVADGLDGGDTRA